MYPAGVRRNPSASFPEACSTNPYLKEYSAKYRLPFEATRAGAEAMYPEYQEKLKTMASPVRQPPRSR